jgi:hypothetical protein
MNRERARELLPIIQAFAEGKEIQDAFIDEGTVWCDNDSPDFNNDSLIFRIKPEPITIYVNKYLPHGSFPATVHASIHDSEQYKSSDNREWVAKEFKEVL